MVNAQDGIQSNPEIQELNQQHSELNLNDDKTLLMDAESKASKSQSTPHESTTVTNNKNKSDSSIKPSSSEKPEEDPLSFNFLYFIIQKFKVSDIVED